MSETMEQTIDLQSVIDDYNEPAVRLSQFESYVPATMTMYTFTPELCRQILKHHNFKTNRNLNKGKLERLTQDMRDGNWIYTPATIGFFSDGTLQDGHTRLNACVRAGVPFRSNVSLGLGPESVAYTDQSGTARTIGQQLQMMGVCPQDPFVFAGAVKLVKMYDDGLIHQKRVRNYIDAHYIAGFNQLNPAMSDIARKSHTKTLDTLFSGPSVCAALWFILRRVNAAKADEFFHILPRLDGVNTTHPIFMAHMKLKDMKTDNLRAARRKKYEIIDEFAVVIQAFNRFVQGRTTSVMYTAKINDGIKVVPEITRKAYRNNV